MIPKTIQEIHGSIDFGLGNVWTGDEKATLAYSAAGYSGPLNIAYVKYISVPFSYVTRLCARRHQHKQARKMLSAFRARNSSLISPFSALLKVSECIVLFYSSTWGEDEFR